MAVECVFERHHLALVSVDARFEARQLLCACRSNLCHLFFVLCLYFGDAAREGGVVGLLRGQIASDLPDPLLLSFQLLEGLFELCP